MLTTIAPFPLTPSINYLVHILNDMDDNSKPLIVRCQSGDDDLGYKLLKKGESFSWKFKLHFFADTLFFCRIRWGNEKNRIFDAFEEEIDNRICEVHARDGDYFWKANSKGIYFSCDGENFRKRCEWDQNIECTDW
ncbi:hypothetical protein RND81_01G033100 [Saponaria officinalis]|uniref:S-protein homolog n=1 Tax=Saponaria officinalis TaxID=3572 RepID=A0AAW1NB72_SAPOF